ncbi:hypothetical protein [Algoriphagus aquimarinus]|uniref:hypothetical protein n=1 Tax=Algoriphagus aquimarinus TaxID=237018 RepID=UPI0030DC1C0C|tara:strand:+ start:2273 stop:3376 length:1104 start_codon:yes stop_codon:yes gene_type:complete
MIYSCGPSDSEKIVEGEKYVPELVIRDSIVIDRLTKPTMVDVKPDHSEFLFYDFKTSEFFRISKSGENLKTADLTGDGKNSIQAGYFVGAKYAKDDKILILTLSGIYEYDLGFTLINKVTNSFELITRIVGGSKSFDTFKDYLYTFSVEEKDRSTIYQSEKFSNSYPFITIRDLTTYAIITSDSVPGESLMAKNPGFYTLLDPIVKFRKGELYMVFPNSPEMYVYDLPSLNLKDQWELEPGDTYKLAEPTEPMDPRGFILSMGSGVYKDFTFSNDYLVTIYQNAIPTDELELITPENISSDKSKEIMKKYWAQPNYQIFKGKDKVWEGQWDIKLSMLRDVIFAFSKPGEDPDAFEKDMQTIYLYELK